MNDDEIENVIAEIMMKDGPDGHCDGADVIASFAVALRNGSEKAWLETYNKGGRFAVLVPPNV